MAADAQPRAKFPYLEEGAGTPVVLVHGSSTDHRIWAPHMAAIGRHFRVIAPTLPYFGPSPWPDDGRGFGVAAHAADLREFISALGIEPVSLVGWSYGAAVCLLVAVQQPQLVERLVLYEPAIVSFVDAPDDAQTAATDRLEMTAPARARIRDGDAEAAVQLFMDGVNDQPGTFDRLPGRVQKIMLENSRTLQLLFAAPPPALSGRELERLAIPHVLVARGQATRAFYRIAAEWTAACVPASKLVVVAGARHLLPVEDHTRVATLILDALAPIRPRPA